MTPAFVLPEEEQIILGKIAYEAIDTYVHGDKPQPPDENSMPPSLLRKLACFVTLKTHGTRLRGCMGLLEARNPLFFNVWLMALRSAFEDPRFPPLTRFEWPAISMDINVLDVMKPCPDPQSVVIGRDGVFIRLRGRSAVFLPSVAVEQGWDLDTCLRQLCLKAGLPGTAWTSPEAALFTFKSFEFKVRLP